MEQQAEKVNPSQPEDQQRQVCSMPPQQMGCEHMRPTANNLLPSRSLCVYGGEEGTRRGPCVVSHADPAQSAGCDQWSPWCTASCFPGYFSENKLCEQDPAEIHKVLTSDHVQLW